MASGGSVTALHYAAAAPEAPAALIIAHGAGAGQLSGFMTATARTVANLGFDVVTFDFPYMEARRRVPDRAPVLEACYSAVVAATSQRLQPHALFIGGKSMGGRMATHIAAADPTLPIAGLVLFGYPLHPPGKPQQRRDAHLPSIRVPTLVIQGSRDTFGTPDELRPAFALVAAPVTLHPIEGGDHSFKVSPGGKARQSAVDDEVCRTAAAWMRATADAGDAGGTMGSDG
jgi:predicted alpha/beta-hydrolase family hydrolase